MNAEASPAAPEAVRRVDLDRAKGLGILLVVFGHLVAKERPAGNDWYAIAQTAVYQFHMPFFMYLSGYVCFLSGAATVTGSSWRTLAARRAQRLLVPFFVLGLLLAVGKALAARLIHVDNAPVSLGTALIGLFWHTDHSPAISIWYIGVLFVYVVATPLLWRACAGRFLPLACVALVLYLVPVPPIAFLDRICTYYVFFIAGGLAAFQGDRWLAWMDRSAAWTSACFVVAVAVCTGAFDAVPAHVRLLACGLLSMPALHACVRLTPLAGSRWLLALGNLSFAIYLFNTPFIGLAKGVMLRFLPWDGVNFLLYAPILMAAGVLGPIAFKRLILARQPHLDRLTG